MKTNLSIVIESNHLLHEEKDVGRDRRKVLQKDIRKFEGMTNFSLFIDDGLHLHPYAKAYQLVHFKCVQDLVWQLYFYKTVKYEIQEDLHKCTWM